ncbi:hypothetical protein BN2476_250178 [Paraburkholderia piptadeniae]|uniref:EAL domain-containing protein n=1 Tax=Paraburkholderia piptadeniae TaxID=1701573 RepID=A0A1N7S0R7_9BURK|nr:EAL domain-containing protein [Paraburkholderia piptadeniae]SIT40989.1 hypothetical protein BN2476_250178 [Paraburkholderia piptadeniae]
MHGQAEVFREPYRTYQHAHANEWLAENDLPPVSAWYQPKIELATGVTAEGVETATDIERVRAAGCDFAQGFAISRALPQQALKDFLSRRQ